MLAILAQAEKTLFLPPARSTIAGAHDGLYSFVLWMSVFWLVLIAGVLVYFVIKYRRKSPHDKPVGPTHSTAIELGWTLPPLVLVMIIFVWGFRGFRDMNLAPNGAYQVMVSASKWNWAFTYGGGESDGVLHVPVNTPISLVLTSTDVIHSFYVPDFRIKKDVVPGRYNKTWFQATKVGTYNLFCAEYCGQQHSQMLSKVVVESMDDFKAYLVERGKWWEGEKPADVGRTVYQDRGCVQCHSLDGTPGTGPSWKDLFGAERQFADGTTRTADEDYIRESILNPGREVLAGYDNVMPTFQGQIKDPEITGVIELLKSISTHYDGMVLEAMPAGPGDGKTGGEAGGETGGGAGGETGEPKTQP
jgi:cytochrome c oxidase subunit II